MILQILHILLISLGINVNNQQPKHSLHRQPEYKTVNISGTIALMDEYGNITEQIEVPQNLAEIDIGSNVTSIGNNAFYSCYALKSVTIPTSVTSIGNNVFTSCYSLETITVLGKTTSEAQTMLANANVPEGCTIIGELG